MEHAPASPVSAISTDISFRSAAFRRVIEEIDRFARDPHAALLIEGESGTGKTAMARYIHQRSPRIEGPFESVVLSALDDALANSELFGHVAGAFTDARSSRAGAFALGHGGTLFLDEIGKASASVQQKLLHAVEYGEIRPLGSERTLRVDVRIVAASNVCLEEQSRAGRFLPDLYARLGTFRIQMPPLRERRADIPILVRHYVDVHAPVCGYDDGGPDVQEDLMRALERAEWPHNLRQLHSTVHRLVVEAEGARTITLDHCRGPLEYLRRADDRPKELTLATIDDAVARAGGNISRAAALLGVDRTTLYRSRERLRRAGTAA